MVGLLRFAVIFFLVYFLISLFTRYVLPIVMRFFFTRMSDRVRRDYERQMRERKQKEKEGEITIRYRPGKDKAFTRDDGDYVDYEEMDDK